MNDFPELDMGNEREEKDGAYHTPNRVKRQVETVFTAIVGELAQYRGQPFASLDRDDHAEQVLPMRLNQFLIHHIITKEGVDVFITLCLWLADRTQVLAIMDTRCGSAMCLSPAGGLATDDGASISLPRSASLA